MSLLEVQEVTRRFVRGGRSFEAVSSVSLSLKEGEFIYITGRSGSGKTTLLNLMTGFLVPESGNVLFAGRNINLWTDEEKSAYRNREIGYVPQQLGTLPNLTVVENVALPAVLLSKTDRGAAMQRAAALLDWMGVLSLRDAFPNSLSGGELKRVLLARALMNEPKLLIADEPTADLDAVTTAEIMELLIGLHQKGMALVIVTHEEDLLKHADRVLEMKSGCLSA